ncbi:hypothetical protein Rs2_11455 [Raphanus sativus]|nr:hypothetical protein Rs2_11455 [Raphanus sativus]
MVPAGASPNRSLLLPQTRQAFSSSSKQQQPPSNRKHTQPSSSSSAADPDDAAAAEFVGDDPLAASNGQVIVGVESKYRVVYRLVNSIYILGVTVADHDNSINVFECIHIVNQAVSVIVTACRGSR